MLLSPNLRPVLWASLVVWAVSETLFELEGNGLDSCSVANIEETSTKTLVMCAVTCRNRGCTWFKFEDGVCRLYINEGATASPQPSSLYRRGQTLVNVAFNKPVTASPHYSANVGAKANDCDLVSKYHSRNGETFAWWNVDLGEAFAINSVNVYPNFRSSLHAGRFRGIEVSLGLQPAVNGDATSYTVIGFFEGPYNNQSCCSVDFTPPTPLLARYVHVRRATPYIQTQDYLIVNEILVLV